MSDWLAAAQDPRVVTVDCARQVLADFALAGQFYAVSAVIARLNSRRIPVTEDQARALLEAVAAWDETSGHEGHSLQACQDEQAIRRFRIDAAVTTIVGEQP